MAHPHPSNSRTTVDAKHASVVRARAISIIEIVIVVAVIGILAGLAMPRMASASDRARLGAAERQIRATIERAERRAFRRGETVRLTIFPAQHRLVIVAGAETWTLDLADPPYDVRIDNATFTAGATLEFNPSAGERPGGTIDLRRGPNRRTIQFATGATLDPMSFDATLSGNFIAELDMFAGPGGAAPLGEGGTFTGTDDGGGGGGGGGGPRPGGGGVGTGLETTGGGG